MHEQHNKQCSRCPHRQDPHQRAHFIPEPIGFLTLPQRLAWMNYEAPSNKTIARKAQHFAAISTMDVNHLPIVGRANLTGC
jgi:hypothetical protein